MAADYEKRGWKKMNELHLTMKGFSPMLLHNGQTANPLNKYARQLKKVSGKRNKTDEDFEAMAKIEFFAGLYLNQKGEYVLPAHNIEAVLLEGAKKNKNGKLIQSGVFVAEDPLLVFDGSQKTADELWDGGEHALMVAVRVGKNRVMRTRPMIPEGWTAEVVIHYDQQIVEESVIRQALEVGGREKGMGDWRPKYGRFVVS